MKDIRPLTDWLPEAGKPLMIAGPCSAENEQQVLKTARMLKQFNAVNLFRAGIWKPRTRPNTFEGVGTTGLPWMQKVKAETGLKVTTEVANAKHVEQALEHGIDVLWIGARTSANPFSVQEIADALQGVDIPVMVKNPVTADLALWIGALERIHGAGIRKLAAIHRGFSTFEKTHYRNPPMWKLPMELKRQYPDLPLICDPSHIAGDRHMIQRVSQKAMDLGMNGLMVETHPDPDNAMSDAKQQVTPLMLQHILGELDLRKAFANNPDFKQEMENLRGQIDRIDHEIMEALMHRMEVVREIGAAKIRNDVTALQVKRMDEIMQRQVERGEKAGLRPEYVEELYRTIHEESVKYQTDMMREAHQSRDEDVS